MRSCSGFRWVPCCTVVWANCCCAAAGTGGRAAAPSGEHCLVGRGCRLPACPAIWSRLPSSGRPECHTHFLSYNHPPLLNPQLFYRHTLALHILEVRRPLLAWALHGLRAGVDAIVEASSAGQGAALFACSSGVVMALRSSGCGAAANAAVHSLFCSCAMEQQQAFVSPLLLTPCSTFLALATMQVCTEVAARWLPLQPELYLGSPAGDLETFSADDFQAAAADQPAKLRPLLEALLPLWRLQLDNAAELAPGGTQHKRSKGSTKAAAAAAAGPFRSAAVRPPPPDPSSLPDAALQQEARRLLQQLQRAMPAQRKREREARTAAAFEQADGDSGWAAAEARARRHRQPI